MNNNVLPDSYPQRNKVVSAAEAIALIRDGDTLATGGFVGVGFPEALAVELEKCFLETGKPANLGLVYAAGQGDGKGRGVDHLGHEGLISSVVGGHWGLVPRLQKLAIDNKIQAWNLPQGVISHLFRDIASGKPGTLTHVGLGTFVDPRLGGGKINECTTEDRVVLMPVDGNDYLLYKAFPIQVAFLRGTSADNNGNVSMEREALTLEMQAIAMAVHNSGGVVIVQVERLAERGSLNSRDVKIPGVLVDAVVVAEPEHHWQTFATQYNPAFSGELRVPMSSIDPMPLSDRKVIARRAACELKPNSIVNLGIGMPEGIANVAQEENLLELLTLTAEPGVIGGLPASGLDFGAAVNTQAIIDQPSQFDFYDGGGLDIAFLGLAQVDKSGNVNVSRFGPKLAGAGGFINISQNAGKVVFVGTFTARNQIKFVEQVEQRTFSGELAVLKKQQVLYVTERCVFELIPQGLKLIEIAPGIDINKDVLSHMEFDPIMIETPQLMDSTLFDAPVMGIRKKLFDLPLAERFMYRAKDNLFFINFEGLTINTVEAIDDIQQQVTEHLVAVGKRVNTIVNYDNFMLAPDLVEHYSTMVDGLTERFYKNVTRYTTSSFLRLQLGNVLNRKSENVKLYETQQDALDQLKS